MTIAVPSGGVTGKVKALTDIHHVKQGLPWLADLVLIGALAWMVAGWVQRPGLPTASTAVPTASKQASVDIAALAGLPLFGQAAKKAAPKAMPVVASTLSLKLVGTAVTDHGSVAIVKGAGNKQKVAMVGDVLMPGVVLKRITTDAIDVAHQGRLERITLPKAALVPTAGGASSAAYPAPAAAGAMPGMQAMRQFRQRRAMEPRYRGPPGHGFSRRHPPAPTTTNMSALMRQARLVPHFDQGKVDGILVSGVQPGSRFAAMGLRSGDVIRSFDHKAVDTPQRITALYQDVIAARPIDIGVERGGKQRQLHYKPATP